MNSNPKNPALWPVFRASSESVPDSEYITGRIIDQNVIYGSSLPEDSLEYQWETRKCIPVVLVDCPHLDRLIWIRLASYEKTRSKVTQRKINALRACLAQQRIKGREQQFIDDLPVELRQILKFSPKHKHSIRKTKYIRKIKVLC